MLWRTIINEQSNSKWCGTSAQSVNRTRVCTAVPMMKLSVPSTTRNTARLLPSAWSRSGYAGDVSECQDIREKEIMRGGSTYFVMGNNAIVFSLSAFKTLCRSVVTSMNNVG